MKILGMVGSLRRGSYNRMLMNAARALLAKGNSLELADLSQLPLYSEDLHNEQEFPESVQKLRDQISQADALLISTPEYNYSISGVLKNAIDWASVSPDVPLKRKPVAIMGATPNQFGTVRAQMHLRDILFGAGAEPLYKVEVLVASAKEKFDDAGALVDKETQKFLVQLLEALEEWTEQHKPLVK